MFWAMVLICVAAGWMSPIIGGLAALLCTGGYVAMTKFTDKKFELWRALAFAATPAVSFAAGAFAILIGPGF